MATATFQASEFAQLAIIAVLAKKLSDAGDAIRSVKTISALLAVAGGQARGGDFAGALQTAQRIEANSGKAKAYHRIAGAQVRAGEVDNVKAWVATLKEPAEAVKACLGAVKGLTGEEESEEDLLE